MMQPGPGWTERRNVRYGISAFRSQILLSAMRCLRVMNIFLMFPWLALYVEVRDRYERGASGWS